MRVGVTRAIIKQKQVKSQAHKGTCFIKEGCSGWATAAGGAATGAGAAGGAAAAGAGAWAGAAGAACLGVGAGVGALPRLGIFHCKNNFISIFWG